MQTSAEFTYCVHILIALFIFYPVIYSFNHSYIILFYMYYYFIFIIIILIIIIVINAFIQL